MAYNEFAYFYDEFNGEADYDALYAHIHAKLKEHGIQDGILADLGCGTGELTLMLTQAGYDMIGIDQSEEMLCVVRDKAEQLGLSGRLLLLRQDLLKLDLYGTIDACVCCLDSVNYVTDPKKLKQAFQRVHTFLLPGGLFLFDVNSVEKLSALDGEYRAAVDSGKYKTLLFGDRFPFRYLADDYGLDYYAAFPGCSAETEASFETVSFLAGKMDALGLPCVLTIEGTQHKIAETIVQNTAQKNQQVLTMDSMQAVTANDASSGVSYLSIMEKNLSVLKKALGQEAE